MFCEYCGKEIKMDWKICPVCGNRIPSIYSVAIQNNDFEGISSPATDEITNECMILETDSLVLKYEKMKEYLDLLSKNIDKSERLSSKLEQLYVEEKKRRNPTRFCPTGLYYVTLFGSDLAVAFGFGMGFSSILVGIIVSILMILPALFIVAGVDYKYENNEKYRNEVLDIAKEEANHFYYSNTIKVEKELWESTSYVYTLKKINTFSIIERDVPEAYQNSDAFSFFVDALKKRRADTEKELFNLYEEELHRQRMENYARQGVELQAQTLSMQKQQMEKMSEQLVELQKMSKKQEKISKQVKYGNAVNTVNTVHHWNDVKKIKEEK